MPTFQYPWLLLLLPVALFPLVSARVPAGTLSFSHSTLIHASPTRRVRRRQRALAILQALVGSCLVFGLSGPRLPDRGANLAPEGIALALVVDVSASMATEDFRWRDASVSRLAGVQKVFQLLVAGGESPEGIAFTGRPQDLIGLVSYAAGPETECPLTLDHAALLQQLDRLKPRTLVSEATSNPGDALAWALAGLRTAPARRKVLVFLTDGESNVPPPALRTLQAGQLAASLDIPIYTVDALNQTDTSGDAARAHEMLQALAKLTGGRYFRGGDGPALADALHELDRLERTRLLDFAAERYLPLAPWFALAALLAWATLLLLESSAWRSLP